MQRREAALQEVLDHYEADEAELGGADKAEDAQSVLDTWLQYVPADEVQAAVARADIDRDTTVEKVVETALEVDRGLVKMHRNLAEKAGSERVQEFFESLVTLEERDDKHLSWVELTTRDY